MYKSVLMVVVLAGVIAGCTNKDNQPYDFCDSVPNQLMPVEFVPRSTGLTQSGWYALQVMPDTLYCNPEMQVTLVGNMDLKQISAEERALNQQRAEIVYEYLMAAGVQPTQAKVINGMSQTSVLSNHAAKGITVETECSKKKQP